MFHTLNAFFMSVPVGGECFGVRDPAAEKSASRADRSVLRLSSGPGTEEAHHFCRIHARGEYSGVC